MNRPIKFRAWNKERKAFDVFAPPIEPAVTESESSRYVYEQFTGLTDKNGKEIYEGDIVLSWIGEPPEDIDTVQRLIVVWEQNMFIFKDFADETKIAALIRQADFEIIGNIHENPELLK